MRVTNGPPATKRRDDAARQWRLNPGAGVSEIDRRVDGGYPAAMRRPPPLRTGDVVRVIAPGSAFDLPAFEAGLSVLRDRWGLRTRVRDDVTARTG